jgi:hypothetical protein
MNENLNKYVMVLNLNFESGFDSYSSDGTKMEVLNININTHTKLLNKFISEIEKEKITDLISNFKTSINGNIEKYIFIILSLCLLFNNYDICNRTISSTSAKEKETLRTVILAFDKFCDFKTLDAWRFNQILENVIFSRYFKKIYRKNIAKNKLDIVNLNDSNNQQYGKSASKFYR